MAEARLLSAEDVAEVQREIETVLRLLANYPAAFGEQLKTHLDRALGRLEAGQEPNS